MKRSLLKVAFVAGCILLFATTAHVHGQMGMGGMGGGMGGMGGGMGPGKTQLQILQEDVAKKPETWSRPNGEEPAWLKNGKSSVDATEALRAKLNEAVEIGTSDDFEATKNLLSEKVGLEIEVNSQSLDDEGISVASLPALPAGNGPLREQLRRMLEPRGLAYRVCEGYIEITSKTEARDNPSIRFYDLSYVVRDNSRLVEILNAIYSSVDPESWEQNGGPCTCVPVGQMLVVRTSETNHLDIERLLARLSTNPPPAAAGELFSPN